MKPTTLSPTLRLFALRDIFTGRTVPDLFFSDKQQAKAARDKAAKNGVPLCVTLGPDHRRRQK